MILLSDNARGALMMMAAMAGYACNDVLIKFTAQDIGLYQAILVRGAAATLLLGAVALWQGQVRLPALRRDRALLAVRIATEIVITVLFLTALLHVPLATVTAILQFTPLALTLAAALLLGERVGWRRYAAIAIGFFGVMLIVKPVGDNFNIYALYGLAAMLGVVVRDVITRNMSQGVSSVFVAFSTAAAVTLMAAGVCLTSPWTPMTRGDVGWLMAAAVFILIGYLSSVTSVRCGELSFVSPFRYTVMLWAIGLGWLVLDEVPDMITLLGTIIVATTGIYAIFREAVLMRR
ncbi:MAG: DMT family transporter [Pseudomonadota bacterium]